jgi:hypothetical protein
MVVKEMRENRKETRWKIQGAPWAYRVQPPVNVRLEKEGQTRLI